MMRSPLALVALGGVIAVFAWLVHGGPRGQTTGAARTEPAATPPQTVALGLDLEAGNGEGQGDPRTRQRRTVEASPVQAPSPPPKFEVLVATSSRAQRNAGHAVALVLKGHTETGSEELVLDRRRTDADGRARLRTTRGISADQVADGRLVVRLEETGFLSYDAKIRDLDPDDPGQDRAWVNPYEGFVQRVQVVDREGGAVDVQPEVFGGVARRAERTTGIPKTAHAGPGLADVLVVNDPSGYVVAEHREHGQGMLDMVDLFKAGSSPSPVLLELGQGATAHGRLVDRAGAALPNVTLLFHQAGDSPRGRKPSSRVGVESAKVRTDTAGRFRVEGIARGSYWVIVDGERREAIDIVPVGMGKEDPLELVWGPR